MPILIQYSPHPVLHTLQRATPTKGSFSLQAARRRATSAMPTFTLTRKLPLWRAGAVAPGRAVQSAARPAHRALAARPRPPGAQRAARVPQALTPARAQPSACHVPLAFIRTCLGRRAAKLAASESIRAIRAALTVSRARPALLPWMPTPKLCCRPPPTAKVRVARPKVAGGNKEGKNGASDDRRSDSYVSFLNPYASSSLPSNASLTLPLARRYTANHPGFCNHADAT